MPSGDSVRASANCQVGARLRCFHSLRCFRSHCKVYRLGMMHDDSGSGLLWHELIGCGEIDADGTSCRQQLEHLLVILKIGDGLVAPAIAAPALSWQAEFLANHAVGVF